MKSMRSNGAAGRVERRRRQVEAVVLMLLDREQARHAIAAHAGFGHRVELAAAAAGELTGGIERGGGVAGDQVDDAADRVGAIERRGRALDDLDLLEARRDWRSRLTTPRLMPRAPSSGWPSSSTSTCRESMPWICSPAAPAPSAAAA